jgi:uncharacterized protein (DUF58 family)
METAEIIRKVRKIEIKTRGLSQQIFSGQYHSAFKGRGMTFSEVREYQYGDDIRNIDWNVTARFNHPYVKIFDEERELTVMLVVDVSGSNAFGTRHQLKRELMAEIASVLAFSAIQNNDKVGVIFFSDRIEKYIPPKKGTSHILRILRELIDFEPESQGTNISEALRFLSNVIKKRCTSFVISDFFDHSLDKAMQVASNKHDLVALRILDEREKTLPPVGLVKAFDKESGKSIWIDASNKVVRQHYARWWQEHEDYIKGIFIKNGIDQANFNTGQDYVRPLLNLFKMRETRA